MSVGPQIVNEQLSVEPAASVGQIICRGAQTVIGQLGLARVAVPVEVEVIEGVKGI